MHCVNFIIPTIDFDDDNTESSSSIVNVRNPVNRKRSLEDDQDTEDDADD